MVGPSSPTTRAVTIAALLVVLGRPAWWLLALAGFLARGGIVFFLLAIVSLPSPLVLSNLLAPLITPLAFGTVLPTAVALLVAVVGLVGFWLIGGGWFGAATEVALVRAALDAAAEEGLPGAGRRVVGRWLVTRAAVAHVIAHVPTTIVLGVGSVAIVRVIYAELTNPSDSGPIALRVIAAATTPIAAIVATWALGEIVGGLAVRRIVLGESSVLGGVGRAVIDLVRRPIGALVMPLLTMIVLAIDLGAVLAVVAVVLSEVRDRLTGGFSDPVATGLTAATLGAAWSLALVVTGLIAAWRSVALTFEMVRTTSAAGRMRAASVSPDDRDGTRDATDDPRDDGTIGAVAHRRPGDWSGGDQGVSL